MNRSRPARSKTGCSSCRRRKVRCDETKPVCNACTRLSLACSYEPSRAANSTETLRYRVRFVNSRYTRSRLDETKTNSLPQAQSQAQATPSTSSVSSVPSVGPCQHAAEPVSDPERSPEVSKGNLERRSSGTGTGNPAVPHHSPIQPSPGDLSQHNVVPKAVPGLGPVDPSSQLNGYGAHIDVGYIPAFFDLNMDFDLLGEDWLSPQAPTSAFTSEPEPEPHQFEMPGVGVSTQEATVIISPDDNRLIQHYLNVMTSFAKIRCSGDENIYSHIFSNMALFYAPLFNAIMAWTALHLGQTKSEPDLIRKAEQRYSLAVSLMNQDRNVAVHFELSIVTIWFALQYQLLAAQGIESFCQHLNFAAELVDTRRCRLRAGAEVTPLGHIGSRMLVWLGAYDARGAWIGGTGRLLQSLKLFCEEYDFIDAAYPNLPTNTEDLKPCLRLSLELDHMASRIVQFHRSSVASPATIWLRLQSGLIALQERFENDPSVAPVISYITNPTRALVGKITTRRFNGLLLLAAFYAVVIDFHRMVPAPVAADMPSKLVPVELAATYIIRLASWVCRSRSPSPQNFWPRLIFLAGIETTDIAYQDWVVKTLAEAEVWGGNFRKTRLLLEQVIKIQATEGVRVDYREVMQKHTGVFII